jgi:hypothetical protein
MGIKGTWNASAKRGERKRGGKKILTVNDK